MSDELPITDRLSLPGADLEVSYSRSGGPGGQKVNKTETRVQISFDLAGCQVLSEEVKVRLRCQNPGRLTRDGRLVLACDVHRERLQNLAEARRRLAALVRVALHPPRPRRATRVPPSQKRKRLDAKRHRATVKRQRGRPDED